MVSMFANALMYYLQWFEPWDEITVIGVLAGLSVEEMGATDQVLVARFEGFALIKTSIEFESMIKEASDLNLDYANLTEP